MTSKFVKLFAVFCLVASAVGEETARPPKEIIADRIFTVTDDFIVEVYHNGQSVPDERRTLLVERFGATVELIDVPLRRGDWLVVNVVNNRFRWGGAYYFAAVGQIGKGAERSVGMTSEVGGTAWCACDDPGKVARFIAERDYLRKSAVKPVLVPWHEGDDLMESHAGSSAEAIWGSTRNTWLKFVAE
jgi:hypothetical protein